MKKCTKCNIEKEATRVNFGSTPSGNLRGACRPCVAARVKTHSAANPEQVKARANRRKEVTNNGDFNHAAAAFLRSQKNKCIYCETDISKKFEIDHITPVSRGGTDAIENIQLTCPQCNREKHNKTHEEHLIWRVKVGLESA